MKFDQDQVESALFEAVREVRGRSADDGQDTQRVLRTLTHRGSHTIHQIPWAAQSVLTLLRRRGLGLSEPTRVIEKDPSLSQLLLRHANSAFYAIPGEPVVSIKRAIQRVGTEGVHGVVMFQSIQGQLSRPGGEMDHPGWGSSTTWGSWPSSTTSPISGSRCAATSTCRPSSSERPWRPSTASWAPWRSSNGAWTDPRRVP